MALSAPLLYRLLIFRSASLPTILYICYFTSLRWILFLRSFLVTIGCTATIRRLIGQLVNYFSSDDFRLLFRRPLVQDPTGLPTRLFRVYLLLPAHHPFPLPLLLPLLLPSRLGILRLLRFLLFLLLMLLLMHALHAYLALQFLQSPFPLPTPRQFPVTPPKLNRPTSRASRKNTTNSRTCSARPKLENWRHTDPTTSKSIWRKMPNRLSEGCIRFRNMNWRRYGYFWTKT